VVTDYVQFLMKAMAILLLLPLAIISAGGFSKAFSNLPSGFFNMSNGPFGWIYIMGFVVTVIISYNASWSLAQKYYSVGREKDAAKAAYCSGVLNLIGAPLMILPAVIGRNLLPDLVARGRTADTYVLLVMKLLPVGMVGIIMAAMFSATMAMVSADYNAIASVLTKDVYHRLIHPQAGERRLLAVGRWTTLGLGIITTLMSLWIALTRTQSLFNIMVTVLGLFMAPTFLPLLAGLSVRWLTWKGAFAGFLCGLSTGFVMLGLKTWYFQGDYQFEGISLLANAAMTIVGMVVFSRGPAHSEKFFQALDTPIADSELPKKGSNPAGPVLGVSTMAVGALLAVAGVFSGSALARWIDLSVAALLVVVGLLFRRQKASS